MFLEKPRPNILTGNLPDGFLRLESGISAQSVPFPQAVYASGGAQFYPTYYQKGGILSVTFSQVCSFILSTSQVFNFSQFFSLC